MSEQEYKKNLDDERLRFGQRFSKYKEIHEVAKEEAERMNRSNSGGRYNKEDSYRHNLSNERAKNNQEQFAADAGRYAAKKLAGSLGNTHVAAAKISWDLFKNVHWTIDWMILFPFFLAIIKDILDWVGFSLPVLNEALNLSIGGLTALILAVLSAGAKKAGFSRKSVRKFVVLLMGIAAEELFGLNFLPIESITVAVCFLLVLLERVIEEEQKKETGAAEPAGSPA